jgi:dihydropteroate synthase
MGDKDTFFSTKRTLNIRGELLTISTPLVMGVINTTPDSFYGKSRKRGVVEILSETEKMVAEGASIIDVGGYSSRPGARRVDEAEEWERLEPALKGIRKKFPKLILSIDTFRSGIAARAVNDYEVDIINDVSAGELDTNMFLTIAELQVPYIMMHMQGDPNNMQSKAIYDNVVTEVIRYFSVKIHQLRHLGINDLIIDPGFGFAKDLDHNYRLLHELEVFKMFELPLLVGVSRKSMIYNLLQVSPDEALNGTTVLNTMALWKGANILRVHDVGEAVEVVKMVEKIKNS